MVICLLRGVVVTSTLGGALVTLRVVVTVVVSVVVAAVVVLLVVEGVVMGTRWSLPLLPGLSVTRMGFLTIRVELVVEVAASTLDSNFLTPALFLAPRC